MSHILDNFEALPRATKPTKPYAELFGSSDESLNHRVAYRNKFAEDWKYRYFKTSGECYIAFKQMRRNGYIIARQFRHADGTWREL